MTLSTPAPLVPELHDLSRATSIADDYAQRAVRRASAIGAASLLDGRVVLSCDRLSGRAERYAVACDPLSFTLALLTARQAWAIVAALHESLGG